MLAEKIIRRLLKKIKISAFITQNSSDYYRLTIRFINPLSKRVKFLNDLDVIDIHPELKGIDIPKGAFDAYIEFDLKSFFRKLPRGKFSQFVFCMT